MKQVNMRQLGRLSADKIRRGPFEIVSQGKPIARVIPYDRPPPMPLHDFTGELRAAFGTRKRKEGFDFPELSEGGEVL